MRDMPRAKGERSATNRATAAPEPRATAGYSGTPLPKKLGIREGTAVFLRRPPAGFERMLVPLPEGAVVRTRGRGPRDVTIWFLRSAKDLAADLPAMLEAAGPGKLWLAWPKKASGVRTDLTENVLREHVLPRGWVDIKVCAIDAVWSGLLFSHRKSR